MNDAFVWEKGGVVSHRHARCDISTVATVFAVL